MEIIDNELRRKDGRELDQFRDATIMQNIFPNLSGSCQIVSGGTVILATVHGPASKLNESQKLLAIDLTYSPQSTEKIHVSKKDTAKLGEYSCWLEELFLSNIIDDSLHNSVIEVKVVVDRDDGSVLANAVTAISIALMDAEIPMRSLLTGAAFSYFYYSSAANYTETPCLIPEKISEVSSKDSNINRAYTAILIDPLRFEEIQGSSSVITFVTNPFTNKVSGSRIDGKLIPLSVYSNLISCAKNQIENFNENFIENISS